MASRNAALDHLGPMGRVVPVDGLCALTERVWSTYHDLAGPYEHQDTRGREYLITRMLYIAEATSIAIRLNASWLLSPSAMSLLRDRYEQTIRFSWLARSPNEIEFDKYERSMRSKMNVLVRDMPPQTREAYQQLTGHPLPAWATETPSREERANLNEWNTLDLRSMAKKRDAIPPIADTHLARETLERWYGPIYSQFSSVTHYDRFAIELLGLQISPDGTFALPARHWPGMLMLQNCLFDTIQCFETALVCHKQDAAKTFEALYMEWIGIAKKITPE